MSRRRWIRRALGTGLCALGLVGAVPPGAAHAAVPVLVLDGTGYGHGVGLSQWGAEYLARRGQSATQILATFYPGTTLSQASGPVRVAVHTPPTATTTLSFPQGGEVRSPAEGAQAPGFPVRVGPGGRARITFEGAYRVEALVSAQAAGGATTYRAEPCPLLVVCDPTTPPTAPTTTTTAPPAGTSTPPTTAGGSPGSGGDPGPPASAPATSQSAASSPDPVVAVPAQAGVTTVDERGRTYRGTIEATGGAALRLVNIVAIEDYLRGMAEVPGTWPAAAVQAQTIAARTYALRAMRTGGELCDDARCQVYVGRTAETAGQDKAVAATTKRVLTYKGALAAAVYSADAGGISATTLEGFGTPDGVYPYLTTVRYDTDNPLPWRLDIALSDVASRLGYRGTVTGVRVDTTGPSGRALGLVVQGTAGDLSVDGRSFARALGLRSTRFMATMGSSEAAPPPPPPTEEAIQELPDDAAAIAQQPARRFGDDLPVRPLVGRIDVGLPLPTSTRHGASVLVLLGTLALAGLVGAHVPLAIAPTGARTELVARVRAKAGRRIPARIRRRSPSSPT